MSLIVWFFYLVLFIIILNGKNCELGIRMCNSIRNVATSQCSRTRQMATRQKCLVWTRVNPPIWFADRTLLYLFIWVAITTLAWQMHFHFLVVRCVCHKVRTLNRWRRSSSSASMAHLRMANPSTPVWWKDRSTVCKQQMSNRTNGAEVSVFDDYYYQLRMVKLDTFSHKYTDGAKFRTAHNPQCDQTWLWSWRGIWYSDFIKRISLAWGAMSIHHIFIFKLFLSYQWQILK